MLDSSSPTPLSRAVFGIAPVETADLRLSAEHGLGVAKMQVLGAEADRHFAELALRRPDEGRQIASDSLTIAWLAPNEWLVCGPEQDLTRWMANVPEASDRLAVDLTHARVSFLVSGPQARRLFAGHCPLDLWDGNFPVDAVARSLLGDTVMFIARLPDVDGAPCFRIIVDQSMAAYAARLLTRN